MTQMEIRSATCWGPPQRPLQTHDPIQTWDLQGQVVDDLGKLFPPQGSLLLFFCGCSENKASCSHLSPSLKTKPAPGGGQS